VATSWTTSLQLLGPDLGPHIGPWREYAAYRVLRYVDAPGTDLIELRVVQLPGDPTPRMADVRRAFIPRVRSLSLVF